MTQRLNAWNQPVTPQDTKAGEWADAWLNRPRCQHCGNPTPRPPVCTGCVETILQQRVSQ